MRMLKNSAIIINSRAVHIYIHKMPVSLLLPVIMALVDTLSLPIVKFVHQGLYGTWMLLVPMILFSLQPLMVYYSLSSINLTSVNIIWDLMSDVFITIIGLYYLKEKLAPTSQVGLILAFVAIIFFAMSAYAGEKI